MKPLFAFLIDLVTTLLLFYAAIYLVYWCSTAIHLQLAVFLLILIFINGTRTLSEPISNYIRNYFNLGPYGHYF